MKNLVNKIIAPYFKSKKAELGIIIPEYQSLLWKIDCLSVHKLKAFLDWMKKTHPNIVIDFVPRNCTCVFQQKKQNDTSKNGKAKKDAQPEDNNDKELPFSPEFDNPSNIPLEAQVKHIISDREVEGLAVTEDGLLARTSDMDEALGEPVLVEEAQEMPEQPELASARCSCSGRKLKHPTWYDSKDWSLIDLMCWRWLCN